MIALSGLARRALLHTLHNLRRDDCVNSHNRHESNKGMDGYGYIGCGYIGYGYIGYGYIGYGYLDAFLPVF
jgi:hypothetical protein